MAVEKGMKPAEVSHRFAEAINVGDLESALACWSPAGVLVDQEGQLVRGHTELAERFRGLIAIGARLRISVADEVCTDQGAMATTEMQITVAHDGEETVIEIAAVVFYVPGREGLQILFDRLIRRAGSETP